MIFVALCGALFVSGGAFAAWFLLRQASLDGIRFWLAGLCLPFVGLGVYSLLVTFVSSVTLFENRIEVTDLKGTAVLFLDDIEACRSAPESPSETILIPKDKQRPPAKISQLLAVDPTLVEWLGKIPRQETSAALKSKWLAPTLNVCAVLVTFALLVPAAIPQSPEPYRFAILSVIALPWICLFVVWKSSGFFHLRSRSKDPLSSLVISFSAPIMVLTVRAFHYNLLDHTPIAKLAVVIAVLLWLAAHKADRTARVISLILLAALYGYGVSAEANGLFDNSPALTFRVSVRDKRIIPRKSRSYRLYLDPWGPLPDLNNIDVNQQMFNRIQSGDTIQIALKQGALGAPWYFIAQPKTGR
jgi:hypothetical protein